MFKTFIMNQDLYPVTNDELERLIILNEECSEVQKIISKILRHGFSSVDPTNTEDVKPTNRKMLVEEKKKSEEKIKKLAANKKSQQDTISASSGTGFFVTNLGHIVSNNHVVDSCSAVKVHYKGDVSVAKILAVDRSNDLALMKIDYNTNDFFNISNEDLSTTMF